MTTAAIEIQKPLTDWTDNELVLAYQNNSRSNLVSGELCRRYNGFIRSAAWSLGAKFLGRFDFDEIVQVATVGFLDGVSRFDTEVGSKIATYTSHYVRTALSGFFSDMASETVSKSTKVRRCVIALRKIKNERERHGMSADFSSSDLELVAEATGQSLKIARNALVLLRQQDAAHANFDDLAGEFGCDGVSSLESIANSEASNFLAELKAAIGHREAIIVEEVILADEPLTNAEVGALLGISEARVRQLKGKALNEMKNMCDQRGFVFSDLI